MPTNSAENVREFYRKQGEQRERNRIIELLKENSFEQTVTDSMGILDLPASIDLETAIALIKGETIER